MSLVQTSSALPPQTLLFEAIRADREQIVQQLGELDAVHSPEEKQVAAGQLKEWLGAHLEALETTLYPELASVNPEPAKLNALRAENQAIRALLDSLQTSPNEGSPANWRDTVQALRAKIALHTEHEDQHALTPAARLLGDKLEIIGVEFEHARQKARSADGA